ncbi:hypothetical protein Pint_13725 [Pistacia integerrima]|uniref:Uncharacterized protein n=1 Tax=Pistacia integerrima TaxID=434235 RepID=A0ACC0YCE7_9ROSI|nr:hypothetical protein Pint_13725 [Pistacia integerrima]
MERRIYEAVVEGNIISLLNLLQEDALILDRITPELAGVFDSRKSSPLHLATSKGYLDIVKILVSVNPEMCFVCDRDGKNPVHIAAIKGHVSVIKEFVKGRPNAARMLTERGETILHAFVRFDQLEAMEFLVEAINDHEFMNSEDDDGNTLLHICI